MEEIEAQSFGRTWGWVKNYSIFPLWVKYPYKNVILSYCINHGAIYCTACTNQFNFFFYINDVTDICITHSFCRYFKLLKVFLGRSESLLQDKSLKNKEKQTNLSDEWNPCAYKDNLNYVPNLITLKSKDCTSRLCAAVLTVQPKTQENETCFLEGSWFYCHAEIWVYKNERTT